MNFACHCCLLHLRARGKCVRQLLNWTFSPPLPCLSFTFIRCDRGGRKQRGAHIVSTFPPPRVDITSKTWPSFADMLLRRWREGGTFGESVFFFFFFLLRPSVTSRPGWGRGGNGGEAPHLRRGTRSQAAARRFERNFWSPTLFIDFDLRDSDVGVPLRCPLPSVTTACRHIGL